MYKPSTKDAWKGRVDVLDGELGIRWHQAVSLLNLTEGLQKVPESEIGYAFLGFCCDEGVRRNQGRIGAATGPAALRGSMASFAMHLPGHVKLYDAGDVICTNLNLEEAQDQLGKKVALLLQNGYRPLVLGGGHEIAYGHYLGLEQALQNKQQRLGILNFDAHFDLRSYQQQPSSGTPFLQIADRLKSQQKSFVYYVIGLQEYGNTRKLFETANQLNVKYAEAEEIKLSNLQHLQLDVQKFLDQVDAVYLTIDLDVFSAAFAPGVSAVNAMGIQPEIALTLLKQVAVSGKLLSLDIAELNPAFDQDNRTAKLGATLLYKLIDTWSRV